MQILSYFFLVKIVCPSFCPFLLCAYIFVMIPSNKCFTKLPKPEKRSLNELIYFLHYMTEHKIQNQKHTFYQIFSHQKANILPQSLLFLAGNYDVEKRSSPQFSKFSQCELQETNHSFCLLQKLSFTRYHKTRQTTSYSSIQWNLKGHYSTYFL